MTSDSPQTAARALDAINQRVYENESVVETCYAKRCALFPAEEAIIRHVAPAVRNKAILDLGVGGGRTTAHLLQLSSNYLGADYSHEMVAVCRKRYPGVSFEEADARHMPDFPSESFDLIVFSFNGMDYVGHEDRQLVLAEVFRLLKPGGFFWFSSHNLYCRPAKPWHHSHYYRGMNPRSILRSIYLWMGNIRNYLRNSRLIVEGADYAVLIDDLHRFRMLTYYVTPHEQVRQLRAHGFEPRLIIHHNGDVSSVDDPTLRQSIHVQYLANKPQSG